MVTFLQDFKRNIHVLPLLLLLLLITPPTVSKGQGNHHQRRGRQPPKTPTSASGGSGVKCKLPGQRELEKKLQSEICGASSLHESFYQWEDFRNTALQKGSREKESSLKTFMEKHNGKPNIRRVFLDPNDKRHDCTPHHYQTSRGAVADPCPMKMVLNVDQGRTPKIMVEGQCLRCKSCMTSARSESRNGSEVSQRSSHQVHPGSEGSGPLKNPDLTECVEVTHYTKVLRYTCNETTGKMDYHVVLEPLVMGCACKRVMPSRASETTTRIAIHPTES